MSLGPASQLSFSHSCFLSPLSQSPLSSFTSLVKVLILRALLNNPVSQATSQSSQPAMDIIKSMGFISVHRLLLLLLGRFSRVRLCATPQMAAHQAPLSLGFSRQEHWSGLPFPSPSTQASNPHFTNRQFRPPSKVTFQMITVSHGLNMFQSAGILTLCSFHFPCDANIAICLQHL